MEYKKEVEEVESILKKGTIKLDKEDLINLSQLKKYIRGEDDTEELEQAVELQGPIEQKQGKRSYHYMHKKYLEVTLANRGENLEKKKELLKQTEELMELAHQLTYHQLERYSQMLFRLTQLAYEVDRTKLKKVSKEIIKISHYNPFEYVSYYFGVLGRLVECDELEMTEQLLGVIEALPETQIQRYAQLISQQYQEAQLTKNIIKMVFIDFIVKERKEWGKRMKEMMPRLKIPKFSSKEIKKAVNEKIQRLWKEGWKYFKEEDWVKFDRVAREAQILCKEFPQLKDHPAYGNCIYDQIYSHWKRRDKSQFAKALQTHSKINLIKATNNNNILVVIRYIFFASHCFDLQLYEEGFSTIIQINSIQVTTWELASVKSPQRIQSIQNIIKIGSKSNLLPQLELLAQMYLHLELDLPKEWALILKRMEEVEMLFKESGLLNLQMLPVDLPLPLFQHIAEEYLLRQRNYHAQELCKTVLMRYPSTALQQQAKRVGTGIKKLHKGQQLMPMKQVLELGLNCGEMRELVVGRRTVLKGFEFLSSERVCMAREVCEQGMQLADEQLRKELLKRKKVLEKLHISFK